MSSDKDFILYGASGHGRVILDTLEVAGQRVSYFIDDNPDLAVFEAVPVLSRNAFDQLDENKKWSLIVSIGNNRIRKEISLGLSMHEFGKAIHDKAIVSSKALIGAGTVVMAGAVINANVHIGKHVIINTSASVDHDCSIADYVHISPNATLCGNVTIAEGAHIAAGATLIPGISVGAWSTVGAGAVVLRDVPAGVTVIGNPATIIKINKQ